MLPQIFAVLCVFILYDMSRNGLRIRLFSSLGKPARLLASESIQASTMTKSVTKLGMEHLKMASLPTMMLSGEMLISYLWFVTEIRKQDDNMQGRTTSSGENAKRIPRVYWDAQDHDAAAMVTGQLAAENISLRVHPGLCRHKVRDEARHRAFEYCIVASNHILTKYVNLKMLTCHWKIAKNM